MHRVSIVGSSGSGKTTTGTALARRLGVPFIELDAIHHQPGWTQIAPDEFRATLDELTSGDEWVIDGNYESVVRDGPVWSRADTIVWLDVPRWYAMWQVSKRTVGRAVRRTELWNGNREEFGNLFSWDPERNMIRWVWTTHGEVRRRYADLLDPAPDGVVVVRLASRREIASWLGAI